MHRSREIVPQVDTLSPELLKLAEGLFGAWMREPGVHRVPQGGMVVWYLVVSDAGVVQALSVLPAALSTPATLDQFWLWRGGAKPSSVPRLSLLR